MVILRRIFQLGAAWWGFISVSDLFNTGNHFIFIAALFGAVISLVIAQYGLRTFPRKVSLDGDLIVFHKVPTAWFPIGGIAIPLGITERVEWPIATLALEWFGRSLSLNDIRNGKSIPLASGNQGKQLAAWFIAAGVSEPVGG